MTTLTLENRIQTYDVELKELYDRITKLKEQKSALVAQQKRANKLLEKIEKIKQEAIELSVQLGEDFLERVKSCFSEEKQSTEATDATEATEPLQPSSNKNLYYSIEESGDLSTVYIGARTKAIAESVSSKLRKYLPSLECQVRSGKRTDSKYELKIAAGLEERHILWLQELDLEQPKTWSEPNLPAKPELDLALSASSNKEHLKQGSVVFHPETNSDCELLDWDDMEAEVLNLGLGIKKKYYLTQLAVKV